MILFAFKTDKGKARQKNEDAFGHFQDEFFVVADGLGGLPAGEVAAQLGVDKAVETYQEFEDIQRAFEVANHEIYRQSRENPAFLGMCTTLVGVAVEGKKATLANVGDSRAYLVSSNQISQVTVDHGMGMGVVTRVLGINPEVKIDIFEKELKTGDLLLLCTDGLTGMLSDEEILEILKDSGETKKALEKKAKNLIEAANTVGGFDNITVCLVKITSRSS